MCACSYCRREGPAVVCYIINYHDFCYLLLFLSRTRSSETNLCYLLLTRKSTNTIIILFVLRLIIATLLCYDTVTATMMMMMMKLSVKRGSILSYTTILSLSSWSYTEFKLGAILYAPTMMNHFVNNTYAALVAQNKYNTIFNVL